MCGRKDADPGAGPVSTRAADNAGHARAPHPRLRARWRHRLFAALNSATGEVIGQIHRRHGAVEFKKFLVRIDKEIPAGLDVHLICDTASTHKTPAIQRWLTAHPRFHVHFTPTGSS
ncbi:transposase [Streptomyces sirii]|uniref:transposase n=1 Tax=Streptomyces sirii TaxID=3127701 RepID=UPI003D36640A